MYAQKSYYVIERNHPDYPEEAVLMDEDGLIIHRFDEGFTDAQIWASFDFANTLYAKGFTVGMSHKTREIRAVLDIPAR